MYIVAFGEIFTKGNNQNLFTGTLIKNIKHALKLENSQIINLRNRYIFLTENADNLKYIFGISWYSKVIQTDFDKIREIALSLVKKESTFKINAKRLTKEYKSSQEINIEIGDYILKNKPKIKVNLDNPEIEIKIEIINGKSYLYSNKTKCKGLQGLPVGTAGNIYLNYNKEETGTVASFLLMKRGCNLLLKKPIKTLNKFNYSNNIKLTSTPSIYTASDKTLKSLPKQKSETIFYPLIGFNDKHIKGMYKKIKEL